MMRAGEAVPARRRLAMCTCAVGGGAQGGQVHLGAAVPGALRQIHQQAQQPPRQVPFVLCPMWAIFRVQRGALLVCALASCQQLR